MSDEYAYVYRDLPTRTSRPNPDDYEWTGEYETMTSEDWYCPTAEDWTMCPGPCPDGREHGPKRTTTMQAKVMRRKVVRDAD